MKTFRKPQLTRSQRLAKQGEAAAIRKQQEAVNLIHQYRDIFELLSDAIFLGQVKSINQAFYYVQDVRQQRYIPENITWKERNELFRLAATQRV